MTVNCGNSDTGGGERLRRAATTSLTDAISAASAATTRLFSVRGDFPTEWARLRAQTPPAGGRRTLTLTLRAEHYPFWSTGRLNRITGVRLFAQQRQPTLTVFDRADAAGAKQDVLARDPGLGNLVTGRLTNVKPPATPVGEFTVYLESAAYGGESAARYSPRNAAANSSGGGGALTAPTPRQPLPVRTGSGPDHRSPAVDCALPHGSRTGLVGNRPDRHTGGHRQPNGSAPMPNLLTMIHDGAFATGAASALYAATVTAAALTALFARTPTRRHDAQDALKILLRRRAGQDPRSGVHRTSDFPAHDFGLRQDLR